MVVTVLIPSMFKPWYKVVTTLWSNLATGLYLPCDRVVTWLVFVYGSLKSQNKIYQLLTCTESEVRVNDYNLLLLMLWKANFVAESSLALAQYDIGNVTKAERSNMQEIWQEVGVRAFKVICGALVYEVCALESAACVRQVICCFGDHLTENLKLSSGLMYRCHIREVVG